MSMAVLAAVCGWITGGLVEAERVVDELRRSADQDRPAAEVFLARGARRLTRDEALSLIPMLPDICRRAGLPTCPEVFLLNETSINAFAAGCVERSAIAVTDGLIKALRDDELSGVLAHEIGHLLNGDPRMLTVADRINATITGAAISTATRMLVEGVHGDRDEARSRLGSLFLLAAPFVSHILHRALSRGREFAADRRAADILGHPRAVVQALRHLEDRRGRCTNARGVALESRPLAALLCSHPDAAERICRLQAWASAGRR